MGNLVKEVQMNRRLSAMVVIFVLMKISLAYASPVEVVIEGQLLSTAQWDSYELNGAYIEVRYAANSTDTPTSIATSDVAVTSIFDVFLMTVSITNRPGGADDLLNASEWCDPMAGNYFPSYSENDSFWFDSRPFNLPDGLTFDVSAWGIDFGSKEYFPGTEPVADLSFLLDPGQNWTLDGMLFVELDGGLGFYQANNLSITIVPEPTTVLLITLGSMMLRRRK
jgi:hypothetical protein